MEVEQNNDLVVVKAAQDEQGTDYLFISADDLFSVGKPAERQRGLQCLNETKYVDRTLLLDAQTIELIFGERWNEPGLLIPTDAELQAMPELRMEELFLKAINMRCKWSAFSEYSRSEYQFTKNADNIPLIYVTHEATDFIPGEAGWAVFREMLIDPITHGGKLIECGTKSLIYEIEWEGHNLVLKALDLKYEAELKEWYKDKGYGRIDFDHRPNYLDRIGFMQLLVDLINDIPDLPFEVTACQEYAYGHNFVLMELVPGMSFDKLWRDEFDSRYSTTAMHLPVKFRPTFEAQEFIDKLGYNNPSFSNVDYIFKSKIDPILKMLRQADVWPDYHYWHHFTLNDLMITGVTSDRKLKVTLINQGMHKSMGDGDGLSDMMCEFNLRKEGKVTYDQLSKDPTYSTYLEKYFPAGWPESDSDAKEESEKDVTVVTV